MSFIFENSSSAFAASRARIACAGDRERNRSGLRVALSSAHIGAKLNRQFSFAGRRRFVGLASRNSSTGEPLQALSACEAVSTCTFIHLPLQLRLADRSYAWHLSSNSAVKSASFGRWTTQKRAAFYLSR